MDNVPTHQQVDVSWNMCVAIVVSIALYQTLLVSPGNSSTSIYQSPSLLSLYYISSTETHVVFPHQSSHVSS